MELLIPIFGIVGVFGMPVFIILIVFYFDKRNKEQFHSTLQKLIESGQELSPELLQSIPGYKEENGERNDIRRGTITSGLGIGIAFFGLIISVTELVGIGALVLSIGLGFLLMAFTTKIRKLMMFLNGNRWRTG